MNLVKNSINSFIYNVIGSAIGFLFQIIAAKYLGAYLFGQANYYLGYSATISVFTGFGLQTFLAKNIYTYENRKKTFSNIFWTSSFLYIIMCPIEYIFFRHNLTMREFTLILLFTYISFAVVLMSGYYIGLNETKKVMFTTRIIYNIVNIGILIILIFFAFKQSYLYLICMIFGNLIIILPFLRKTLSKPEMDFSFFKTSFVFYLNQIVYGVYLSYSKVLQKNFGTFQSVAILSVALTLGNITSMLGDSFAKVSMPEFSKAWNSKDIISLEKNFKLVSRINCYLILPIAIFTIINSQRLLIFLGKGYKNGSIILSMILISQFISSFTGPNGTLLNMTCYSNIEVYNGILKLIVSIVLGFCLGKSYSWGIAFSIAAAEVLVNILKTIELKKLLNIVPYSFKGTTYIVFLFIIQTLLFFLLSNISSFLLWIIVNSSIIVLFYYISFKYSKEKEDRILIYNFLDNLYLILKKCI